MAASASQQELRVVVLGRTPGRTSTVRTILGLQDLQQGEDAAPGEECSKHTAEVAGRKMVVISSPAWFSSGCNPKERRRHISSFVALSTPGPHAFLLCIPVNQPADGEAEALDVLTHLFGPSAVDANTIVLFTQTEELDEDETLEEYLVTWRKDLRGLVERCGHRYHTLATHGGEEEREKAVRELLDKVEVMVEESGSDHFSCPLYAEAEEKVRARQEEIVRRRRGEEPTDSPPEEEEMDAVREEAERSVDELNIEVDDVLPSTVASSPPAAPSFLRGCWEKLTGWLVWLPSLVRREALFGALVGLFVGGPLGGVMGATVGSVATEVKRRKTEKKQ